LEASKNIVYRDGEIKNVNIGGEKPEYFVTLPRLSITVSEEPDREEPSSYSFETVDACILCFSLVDRRSYNAVKYKWAPIIQKSNGTIILVGTKVDKRDEALKLRKTQKEVTKSKKSASYYVSPELRDPSTHEFFKMSNMPPEVMLTIFNKLENHDLINVMRVCKTWRSYASHKLIWKDRKIEGSPITKEEGMKLFQAIKAKVYIECCCTGTFKGVNKVFKESERIAYQIALNRMSASIDTSPYYDDKNKKEDKKEEKKVVKPKEEIPDVDKEDLKGIFKKDEKGKQKVEDTSASTGASTSANPNS